MERPNFLVAVGLAVLTGAASPIIGQRIISAMEGPTTIEQVQATKRLYDSQRRLSRVVIGGSTEQARQDLEKTGGKVRVRAGESTSSAELGTLEKGTVIFDAVLHRGFVSFDCSTVPYERSYVLWPRDEQGMPIEPDVCRVSALYVQSKDKPK